MSEQTEFQKIIGGLVSKGMSQSEIARRAKVSQSYIHEIYNGIHGNKRIGHGIAVALRQLYKDVCLGTEAL